MKYVYAFLAQKKRMIFVCNNLFTEIATIFNVYVRCANKLTILSPFRHAVSKL